MTAPAQLAEWLTANGLSLRAAATRLKCSHQMVAGMREGRIAPGRTLAVRIEQVTGIPVAAWERECADG